MKNVLSILFASLMLTGMATSASATFVLEGHGGGSGHYRHYRHHHVRHHGHHMAVHHHKLSHHKICR